MVGKQLSALLQILRSAGVTAYETPQLKLTLGPAPAPKAPRVAIDVSTPDAEADSDDKDESDEPRDWRFALEQRQDRWFPRRPPNPRKNKAGAVEQ